MFRHLMFCAILVLAAPLPGAQEGTGTKIKNDVKDAGHEIGKTAVKVGHGVRDGAKAVGRTVGHAGARIGHGVKEGARTVGHGVRDAVKRH